MAHILFVDDDRYFASVYLSCLQDYHTVTVRYEAETAVQELSNNPEIVAVVLDMMMPPPDGCAHETHDGVTTGLWILDQCRQTLIDRRIAVLIFTNRGLSYVNTELAFIGLDPNLCQVSAKSAIDAEDLPHTVSKLIDRRNLDLTRG